MRVDDRGAAVRRLTGGDVEALIRIVVRAHVFSDDPDRRVVLVERAASVLGRALAEHDDLALCDALLRRCEERVGEPAQAGAWAAVLHRARAHGIELRRADSRAREPVALTSAVREAMRSALSTTTDRWAACRLFSALMDLWHEPPAETLLIIQQGNDRCLARGASAMLSNDELLLPATGEY